LRGNGRCGCRGHGDHPQGLWLDRPLPEQFLTYIGKSARGDLGQSYTYNRPVADLILDRIGPTILLVLTALVFAIGVQYPVGVFASRKPDSLASGAVTVLSLWDTPCRCSGPAVLLLILFGKVMPGHADRRHARRPAVYGVTGRAAVPDALHITYPVLPAFTLGHRSTSPVQLAWPATERAGGPGIRLHPHRPRQGPERIGGDLQARRCANALVPVVHHRRPAVRQAHLRGSSGGNPCSAGPAWATLGALIAILGRDYRTLLGVLSVLSLLVIVANLMTDLSYRWIDRGCVEMTQFKPTWLTANPPAICRALARPRAWRRLPSQQGRTAGPRPASHHLAGDGARARLCMASTFEIAATPSSSPSQTGASGWAPITVGRDILAGMLIGGRATGAGGSWRRPS
jgi:peptide/nickel transport system permease protein